MATCPKCGTRDTSMALTGTGELVAAPVGSFSLAGVQAKFPARLRHRLTCEKARGGCGWSVTGVVVDGYLVPDQDGQGDEESE